VPSCTSRVQLPGVNWGDTNFEDGFAGPGLLLEEFPNVYVSGRLKDSNGATVPGSNTTTTILTTSHLVYVSNKRFFGARITNSPTDLITHLQGFTHLETETVSGS
jgi:hypothetical protein